MDEPEKLPTVIGDKGRMPSLICESGNAARFAFEEFLYGQVRNPYTRKAYLHAVQQFSRWCDAHSLSLTRLAPADVGRYLDSLSVAAPTRKLHLAALRRFFDGLVLRHVLILNPALSVRSERYQAVEGKTPECKRRANSAAPVGGGIGDRIVQRTTVQ